MHSRVSRLDSTRRQRRLCAVAAFVEPSTTRPRAARSPTWLPARRALSRPLLPLIRERLTSICFPPAAHLLPLHSIPFYLCASVRRACEALPLRCKASAGAAVSSTRAELLQHVKRRKWLLHLGASLKQFSRLKRAYCVPL